MKQLIKIGKVSLLLLVLLGGPAEAHKIAVPAIIDTDVALDDMRALVMLFNSGATDISLLVASDGALAPRAGACKLEGLLHCLDREDIPIAAGKSLGKPPPSCRQWWDEVRVPVLENKTLLTAEFPSAPEKIAEILQSADSDMVYVCLGPLTNLAAALATNPGLSAKISWLIYFGDHPNAAFPGWNTSWDPESARMVFHSGIRTHALCLPDSKLLPFDETLYNEIQSIKTFTAELLVALHDHPTIKKLLVQNHFRVWDEMVAVYLNYPAVFTFTPSSENNGVMVLSGIKRTKLRSAYLSLMGNPADLHLTTRTSVVLKEFPRNPVLFKEDIAPYVQKIIDEHGLEEWKACLLTNELHRHLGIYSLVGAKMGIRARELLEAPFDTVQVRSFAGNAPPLSCLNDGLQVATGASLGRGSITIDEEKPRPEALFFSNNGTVRLALNPDWQKKIAKDVERGTKKYGRLTAEYFAFIRKLSLQYWFNLDRHAIFVEQVE